MVNADQMRAALDAVANALQPAALLAARLRRDTGEQVHAASELEAALDRAVQALRKIQPAGDER